MAQSSSGEHALPTDGGPPASTTQRVAVEQPSDVAKPAPNAPIHVREEFESQIPPANSNSSPSAPLSNQYWTHPDYCFPTIRIAVQGMIFLIPKYLFATKSEKFCTEYNLSTSEDDDSRIIELVDVQLPDFENFMKVLLPRSPFLESRPQPTMVEWISTLKLATKWEFNDLRKVAIEELSKIQPMDPIHRICLAKEYQIYDWLLMGYGEIVERRRPLAEREAERIGLKDALRLSGIIIERIQQNGAAGPPSNADILGVFGSEFEIIKNSSLRYLTKAEKLLKEAKEREAEAEAAKHRLEKGEHEAEQEKRVKERARLMTQMKEIEAQISRIHQEEERVLGLLSDLDPDWTPVQPAKKKKKRKNVVIPSHAVVSKVITADPSEPQSKESGVLMPEVQKD